MGHGKSRKLRQTWVKILVWLMLSVGLSTSCLISFSFDFFFSEMGIVITFRGPARIKFTTVL